tara:strand:- start:10360 stop:11010 length:651 start_codon:yes stop_codon:yes gene_type:complete
MLLITEMSEDVKTTEELNEATGEKQLYIHGIFMQSEVANRNGRRYPSEILSREVDRYVSENINKNRAWGELGHPTGPTINLDRASHRITSLVKEGNNFLGKAKIASTPMGDIVKALIKDGGNLGVSSRGMGSLKAVEGVNEVQGDFHLATPADIVADPSAPDAYVDGIMEGKQWVWENGIIKEKIIDIHHKTIKQASRKELEEAKLAVFQDFISRL